MRLSEALPQDMTIKLSDGNTYVVSELNLNAQAAIEDKYNISLLEVNETDPKKRNGLQIFIEDYLASNVRAWSFLCYQLLRKNHRTMSEEDIGYLITPNTLPQVMSVCMKQLMNSFPVPEALKKEVAAQLDAAMSLTTGL